MVPTPIRAGACLRLYTLDYVPSTYGVVAIVTAWQENGGPPKPPTRIPLNIDHSKFRIRDLISPLR